MLLYTIFIWSIGEGEGEGEEDVFLPYHYILYYTILYVTG